MGFFKRGFNAAFVILATLTANQVNAGTTQPLANFGISSTQASSDEICVEPMAVASAAVDSSQDAEQCVSLDAVATDAAPGPIPTAGSGVGGGGMNTNNGCKYDIWRHNCHNAANYPIVHPPTPNPWGIISCQGDAANGQSGHTYNYTVLDLPAPKGGKSPGKQVCFYNWGDKCCAPSDGKLPPNISGGPALACVKKFCGDQYDPGKTIALPPGQTVEKPAAVTCALDTKKAGGGVADCNKCCDDHAKYWTPSGDPTESPGKQKKYLQDCKMFCNGILAK